MDADETDKNALARNDGNFQDYFALALIRPNAARAREWPNERTTPGRSRAGGGREYGLIKIDNPENGYYGSGLAGCRENRTQPLRNSRRNCRGTTTRRRAASSECVAPAAAGAPHRPRKRFTPRTCVSRAHNHARYIQYDPTAVHPTFLYYARGRRVGR